MQIPHTDLPGMRGRARGFRLRVRNARGEVEEVYDLSKKPTLRELRRIIPEGCAAELDQAVYTIGNRRRRVYALVARYFALPQDRVAQVASRIAKADVNTSTGSQAFVDDMTNDLLRSIEDKSEAGLRQAMRTIERNSDLITPAQHQRLAGMIAGNWAKAVEGIEKLPALQIAMQDGGLAVVRAARQSIAEKFDLKRVLDLAPNATDEETISMMSAARSFYVKDAYGVREGRTARKAQSIMDTALKAGLGREEIAPKLQEELGAYMKREDLNYWTTVSDNFTTRARSLGNMTSMVDAGFETFTVEAILDESTTSTCRFLHGKVISLPASIGLMQSAEQEPRGLDKFNPFIQSKTRAGVTTLQIPHTKVHPKTGKQTTSMRTLATSKATGFGRPDSTGVWSSKVGPGDLEASNVGAPPYHHKCRTMIIPTPGAGGPIAPPRPPPKSKPVRRVKPPVPPAPMAGKPAPPKESTALGIDVPTVGPDRNFDRWGNADATAREGMQKYWTERLPVEKEEFAGWIEKARKEGLEPARRDHFQKMARSFVQKNGRGKRKGIFKTEYGTKAKHKEQRVAFRTRGFSPMGEKGRGRKDRDLWEETHNGINGLIDKKTMMERRPTWGSEQRVMRFRDAGRGTAGRYGQHWPDARDPNRRVHFVAIKGIDKNLEGPSWDGKTLNEAVTAHSSAHELGHVLDAANSNGSALAQAIVQGRIKVNPRKLARFGPSGKVAYWYYPDVRGISEYATCNYSSFAPGGEFTPENLAYFWRDPMRLFEVDEEAFYFITSLLRGL